MAPMEMTATSLVPPPTSMTIRPTGSPMATPARMGAAVVEDLAHEMAQHLLGHLEVGDHAVAQRAGGRDLGRRAPDHPLRVGPDGDDLAGALVDGHHRRLGEHDAA